MGTISQFAHSVGGGESQKEKIGAEAMFVLCLCDMLQFQLAQLHTQFSRAITVFAAKFTRLAVLQIVGNMITVSHFVPKSALSWLTAILNTVNYMFTISFVY